MGSWTLDAQTISEDFNPWGNVTLNVFIEKLRSIAVLGKYDFEREEAGRLLRIFEEELANRIIEEMLGG